MKRTDSDQLTLGVRVPRAPVGPVERHTREANRRRRREGTLTAADAGLVAATVAAAQLVDATRAAHQPYAEAQALRAYLECERDLAARAGGGSDAFAAFLAAMRTAGADDARPAPAQ